jgi:triphosphoribosyl-dephospho-CoA synthase
VADRASPATLQRLGRAATAALHDELELYPKPGLVSLVDAGSHRDMDAATFMRSLFALRHYFPQIAGLGARGAPFAELERCGVDAEQRMLQGTAGINTHRGAVFSLGLLCAAAGRLAALGINMAPGPLRHCLRQTWGAELLARSTRTSASNGQCAAWRYGLRSAGDEAAQGFPVLFETAVPVLSAALASGQAARMARLQTFFSIMAVLDDTNLAHRGGLAGLTFARRAAAGFLAAGGCGRPDALVHAEAIHRDFVARRLSPGGVADVLAAACWVERVCRPLA